MIRNEYNILRLIEVSTKKNRKLLQQFAVRIESFPRHFCRYFDKPKNFRFISYENLRKKEYPVYVVLSLSYPVWIKLSHCFYDDFMYLSVYIYYFATPPPPEHGCGWNWQTRSGDINNNVKSLPRYRRWRQWQQNT